MALPLPCFLISFFSSRSFKSLFACLGDILLSITSLNIGSGKSSSLHHFTMSFVPVPHLSIYFTRNKRLAKEGGCLIVTQKAQKYLKAVYVQYFTML